MRIGSAISGLLLVLFLVVHLAGLLPALMAPVQFEHYASGPASPAMAAGVGGRPGRHRSRASELHHRQSHHESRCRKQCPLSSRRRGRPLDALASAAARWRPV